jgi:acetoin utilization protein AcuB
MKKINVKSAMTKNLKTISWEAPMEEAVDLMDDYRIRHLPVVDAEKCVVGILSDRDVNRAMNPKRPGFAEGSRVSDFMSWPVITVGEERSIKEVAEGLMSEKISAVLVTNKGNEVLGIVTTEDLLRYLLSLVGGEKRESVLDFTYTPLVSELLRETQAVGI